MIYVKINDALYPANINGKTEDSEWDKRESKAITLEMDYETAKSLFVDGLSWSIVCDAQRKVAQTDEEGNPVLDENGNPVYVVEDYIEEYDNSEFCIAGPITDNRDGTMTVKMGKLTDLEEAYEILLGGIE